MEILKFKKEMLIWSHFNWLKSKLLSYLLLIYYSMTWKVIFFKESSLLLFKLAPLAYQKNQTIEMSRHPDFCTNLLLRRTSGSALPVEQYRRYKSIRVQAWSPVLCGFFKTKSRHLTTIIWIQTLISKTDLIDWYYRI